MLTKKLRAYLGAMLDELMGVMKRNHRDHTAAINELRDWVELSMSLDADRVADRFTELVQEQGARVTASDLKRLVRQAVADVQRGNHAA